MAPAVVSPCAAYVLKGYVMTSATWMLLLSAGLRIPRISRARMHQCGQKTRGVQWKKVMSAWGHPVDFFHNPIDRKGHNCS